MILLINRLLPSLKICTLIAFFATFIIYLITSFFQINSISSAELILLPFISALVLFLVFIFIFKLFNKNNIISGIKQKMPKLLLVLLFFISTQISYILFDYILFSVDNSISIDYAMALKMYLLSLGEKNVNDINNFKNLPFSIQNIYQNSLALIIASFTFVYSKKSNL